MIPGRVGLGGEDNSTDFCDSGRGQWTTSTNRVRESNRTTLLESLILAQDERWRRA